MTIRQTPITPEDLGGKEVFVINDIDLVIPPSQISIQKEDLIYNWRTLRSKASTKIPTGHGNVAVHCTIIFTPKELLSLHRLITQFRHSPFCYVDNRYLRESIVPEWPLIQNMAFSMTGLSVSPLAGSSDTWVCELDLVWFNYFPFMHNFLYREDWQTNFIFPSADEEADGDLVSYTIGWNLVGDDYKRVHAKVVANVKKRDQKTEEHIALVREGRLENLRAGSVDTIAIDSWSVTQNRYRDNAKKTLYDMEVAHAGIEFDLLPLPGNMLPSRIVAQPRHSRIYVRYINLLQRDALYKNFGINVEQDLLAIDAAEEIGNKWNYDAFFSSTGENGIAETYGLHGSRVPLALRRKWINQMLESNFGVTFHYHALKEIKLPNKMSQKLQKSKQKLFAKYAAEIQRIKSQFFKQQLPESTDGDLRAVPVLGKPYRMSSPFGDRVHPVLKTTRFHSGADFAAPAGTPLLAPEDGVVVEIRTDSYRNGNGENPGGKQVALRGSKGTWWFLHMNSIGVTKGQQVAKGQTIGTVGASGFRIQGGKRISSSTGPHLHLTFYPTGSSKVADPLPALEAILVQEGQLKIAGDTNDLIEEYNKEIQKVSEVQKELETQLAEEFEFEGDEVEAVQELLSLLATEGWKYYDRDVTVTNVWEKLITINLSNSGYDEVIQGGLPEKFVQQGIVVSNVAGALSHIVANIPVLSHEYPTQQHLGSVEPIYTIEFMVLDDQGNLEGISGTAQFVQAMRSLLQSNARRFRPVIDGWCCSIDTFITRLFGTYQENDFRIYTEGDKIVDMDLKKRAIISNSASSTIEGHPGLSMIQMQLQETNPYVEEVLVSTAPQLQEKEEARKQILQAVFELNFAKEYAKDILAILLAKELGTNGQFLLDRYNGAGNNNYDFNGSLGPVFIREGADGEQLVVAVGQSAITPEVLDILGIPYKYEQYQYLTSGAPIAVSTLGASTVAVNPTAVQDVLVIDDLFTEHDDTFGLNEYLTTNKEVTEKLENSRGLDRLNPEYIRNLYYSTGTRYFDISKLLASNPVLANLPVQEALEYNQALQAVVYTGNRLFAEKQVGGLEVYKIREELYDLPFETNMWKSWQHYLKAFVTSSRYYLQQKNVAAAVGWGRGYDKKAALNSLMSNPNFPIPGSAAAVLNNVSNNAILPANNFSTSFNTTNSGLTSWDSALTANEKRQIANIAKQYYGVGGSPTGVLMGFVEKPFDYIAGLASAAVSSGVEVVDIYEHAHYEAINVLVRRYMNNFPVTIAMPERLKTTYNFLLGDLLGNVIDGKNRVAALESVYDALYNNAYSCGNITAAIDGNPWWQYMEEDQYVLKQDETGLQLTNRTYQRNVRGGLGGVVAGGLGALTLGVVTPKRTAAENPIIQDYGKPLNSPFEYDVNTDAEAIKVRYIHGILSRMADDMLIDPRFLKLFGLEELTLVERQNNITGSECYPDLDLPTHPYYGDSFQVSPDFYMWNIYEDGGALSAIHQEEIISNVNSVIERSYNSLKQMQGGNRWQENQESAIQESSVDDPVQLVTQIQPEGTDSQNDGSGPSSSMFAPHPDAHGSEKEWADKIGDPAYSSSKPSDFLPGIRIAATESSFGEGGGVHVPRRVGPGTYEELRQQFQSVEQMFGSKEGYLNRYVDSTNTPETAGRIEGTNLARPFNYAPSYDVESLKKLARDSSKDLLSQKMSLKRAYPTFKLFFVEEDEFESRFLNFDDFHSYNAVKSFTFVQTRKSPADHAIITIQNVAGTLDGTKRNSIVDLDYFDRTAGKKLESEGDENSSTLTDDPITKDTAQDQPFGAVVLRPGLNVQLRVGFSNDPDNLEVLLSGRVVDVSWNKTGDLAEIMVQSFGTELVQAIKGTGRDETVYTFRTTHELLGHLMLEPEVVHFGRWEFGQLFQIGEAKDYRLDFTDYSREGYLGRFRATNWLSQWVTDHPFMVFGAALGYTAINVLPIGRVTKFFNPILKRIGLGGAVGRIGLGGWKKAFATGATGQAIRRGGKAGAAAARETFESNINRLYEQALRTAGTAEYQAAIQRQYKAALAEILAASSRGKGRSLSVSIDAADKFERYLAGATFKGQWLNAPAAFVARDVGTWSGSVGFKPVKTVFGTVFGTNSVKLVGAAVGATLFADLATELLLEPIYNKTIGAVRKFFSRTKAHLFLTPQDDNLYPPHPKDYMYLERTYSSELLEAVATAASTVAFGERTTGREAFKYGYHFLNPDKILEKKVVPEACQYQLVSTTIWKVFHEMSLRHPGWVYGARPYGTKFRYTMFFGVPSQRYWSRPASNRFIDRSNELRRFIENNRVTEEEFIYLYGQEKFDDLKRRIEKTVQKQIAANPIVSVEELGTITGFNDSANLAADINNPVIDAALDAEQARFDGLVMKHLNQEMVAIPIREYLRGLSLRFTPFRRYHMFSSERDIVWNGIMSSEQAVTNAVDVTYFVSPDADTDDLSEQVKTAVFQAHAMIPPHQLRIAPVRWANCKTYEMATRYGVGELLHRMREMYRGEILLLGNPRIRPWDIGVLVDTYNDMVGPVEVEQVVHTFSHETGFITEVKPAAVVLANEISSWPMVEAMKTWAMAVKDIENRYVGLQAQDNPLGDLGTISTLAGLANLWGGDKFNSFIAQRYQRIFGADGAGVSDIFGENAPDSSSKESLYEDYVWFKQWKEDKDLRVAAASGLLSGVLGLGGVVKEGASAIGQAQAGAEILEGIEGYRSGGTIKQASKIFIKNPKAWAFGAVALGGGAVAAGGYGAARVLSQLDFPSLAWLVGGPILFLHCLRNENIMLIPLIKNGNPIVSGLAYNDPSMIWNHFRGDLNRWAEDTITGTRDMLTLYQRYGSALWNKLNDPELDELTGGGTGVLGI